MAWLVDTKKHGLTIVQGIEGRGEAKKQFVSDSGQQLRIKGNEDQSVSLLRADGSEARHVFGTQRRGK